MADEQARPRMNTAAGAAIVVLAFLYDAVIIFLDWTLFGLAVSWVISLFAYISLSIILAMQRSLGPTRAIIMLAPLVGGCVGVPGWTATIWPLVARTIAADKLSKLAPAAGALAEKLSK